MKFDFQKLDTLIHGDNPLSALEYFDELDRAGATTYEVLGHRAWFLRGIGRLEESLADYEKMTQEKPDDADIAVWHADVLAKLGRPDEAFPILSAVIAKDPRHRAAAQVLADLHQIGASTSSQAGGPPPQSAARNDVLRILENDIAAYPVISYPEIGRTIYEMVRLVRPRLAIEVGSYIGYTTTTIAQALRDNGQGRLHAFDIFAPLANYNSPLLGPCADCLQATRGHLAKAGLDDLVTLHKGDSSELIRTDMKEFAGAVDFALIDGDHTLKGCMKDWRAVDELLAPGGIVLLHDTFPAGCGWFGPKYLLDQLDEKKRDAYRAINLPSPEGFGLAIIQKETKGICGLSMPSLSLLLRERLYYTVRSLRDR